MNIKNRIKIIESRMNITNSNFCRCYGENLKLEVIPITMEEWNRRFDTGEEDCERLPDVCERRCGKPVDKSQIETTFEKIMERPS